MEYLEIGNVKRIILVISHKTYVQYSGLWNIPRYRIRHILEYGIFLNMEYFEIWNIMIMEYLENGKVNDTCFISHKTYVQYFGL